MPSNSSSSDARDRTAAALESKGAPPEQLMIVSLQRSRVTAIRLDVKRLFARKERQRRSSSGPRCDNFRGAVTESITDLPAAQGEIESSDRRGPLVG